MPQCRRDAAERRKNAGRYIIDCNRREYCRSFRVVYFYLDIRIDLLVIVVRISFMTDNCILFICFLSVPANGDRSIKLLSSEP